MAAVAGDEAEVRRVHREWQRATGRDGSYGLTAKRRAAIAQALGWFGVADVVDAVRGCRHDTWRASKPRHFTEPMLLLKDPEAVVKFRDMERDHRAEQARKACELAAPEQRRSQLPQPEGPPMTDEQIRAVFDEVRQRCGMRRRAA